MAKRGPKPKQAPTGGANRTNGESVGGYFRRIFKERPDLLKSRSNDEVLARWLADNPGTSIALQSLL